MPLKLENYLKDLTPGCCTNKVYALVFTHEGEALKDNGLGVLVPTTYLSANHNDFAILLTEDLQRTKYYAVSIPDGDFELNPTPDGESYWIEFWRQEDTGDFSRSDDVLDEVKEFHWSGTQIAKSVLSSEGEKRLATWEAIVSYAYDSELNIGHFMGHLEYNGELQTNATPLILTWVDAAGDVISSVNTTDIIVGQAGIFSWTVPGLSLPADRISAMICQIQDVDGNLHTTVSYSNTWD